MVEEKNDKGDLAINVLVDEVKRYFHRPITPWSFFEIGLIPNGGDIYSKVVSEVGKLEFDQSKNFVLEVYLKENSQVGVWMSCQGNTS